ncbi:MAG: phenylalanine--tRNA ligase subunit beta [Patescibacteria group bacterium]
MNLNISYNWLKEYVKTDLMAHEFAKKLSLSGPSVDRIKKVGANFDKVVVGKMLEISKHPNADKLNVAKIDIGKKEPIQVIFGQMAVLKVGDQLPVAVAPTKLPGGIEILEREMRGVKSQGMCCLDSELGLSDQDKVTFFPAKIKPGTPIAQALELKEDYILDIEVTSNRPDAMSVIGIAREAAAILGDKFLYQEPKGLPPVSPSLGGRSRRSLAMTLKVTVKEPKLCPRYQAAVMTGVKVEPSPLWMQQRLLASGLRPINNLVDITNYILLEFGQPMHVFDYDKLAAAEINVRLAKKGETILALDGKEYELDEKVLIVADGKNPCAVGGIMGGELSGATGITKNVVLEVGNWDPVNIRKTARVLNLHSESSDLYEKGLSPEGTQSALLRAMELVEDLASGQLAGEIIDINNYKHKVKEIKLDTANVSRFLGVTITNSQIKESLDSLGFEVYPVKSRSKRDGSAVLNGVKVPWWRDRDMEGEHDLIEEVARLYGYHNLPTKLMAGDLLSAVIPSEVEKSLNFYWQDKVKDILAGFGLTEIYTYSFISEKQINNCRLNASAHLKISNPLSADFEYLRTSLLPGALQIIIENAGFFSEVKLFDLSNVYLPVKKDDLPLEKTTLLVIVSAKSGKAALNEAKGIFEGLLKRLNISDFKYLKADNAEGVYCPPNSRIIVAEKGIGSISLVEPKVLAAFGVKNDVAFIEVEFEAIASQAKSAPAYHSIPKFPAIELDLSMEVDNVITFTEVANVASDAGAPLVEKVDFLSVYQGDPSQAEAKKLAVNKKALAIRIVYRDLNKTLELAEAQAAHQKIVAALKKGYNIKVR